MLFEANILTKNRKWILGGVAILFLAFFSYVIYSANQGSLPLFIRRLYMFPGGDKVGHLILMGFLAFFVNLLLYPKSFRVLGQSLFIGTLIVSILITVEEVSQILISNRTFDLVDLLFSYLGMIMGDIGVRILKREAIVRERYK